jgi:hypothetical protein
MSNRDPYSDCLFRQALFLQVLLRATDPHFVHFRRAIRAINGTSIVKSCKMRRNLVTSAKVQDADMSVD